MAAAPMTGTCNLPPDVLLSIFSFLPVSDLARCAHVCRQWHEIVTGFTHLWKSKTYVSNRRPSECAETRTVLDTLLPLKEVIINAVLEYRVEVFYPHLTLSVTDIGTVQDCPKLTCESLSTRLDIAGHILDTRSTIEFTALRKLQVLRIPQVNVWPPSIYSADYVVGSALALCPNLSELSLYVDSLSADYLDTVAGIGRLRTLEIDCPDLEKLTFLRLCANSLEYLHLCCPGVPPEEFAALQRLGNLRRLGLSECRVTDGDLWAGAGALTSLDSLLLDRCHLLHELSLLQHMGRLQRLCIVLPPVAGAPLMLRDPRLEHHLNVDLLPPGAVPEHLPLRTMDMNQQGLPEALRLFDAVGVDAAYIDQLASLRHCPELRQLCLQVQVGTDYLEPSTVRLHINLPRPTQE